MSSRSPETNRWYNVIEIFLKSSPVRHSNRRYSSIKKNRDLLHKSRGICHYAYARQTQVNWKKEKDRKDKRRKKRGIIFRLKITLCAKPKQALIALVCCGQYVWLLVCRDMAIWPLFLCPEWLYRDALGTNCIDSSRRRAFGTNCGRMAIFALREKYSRTPAKKVASLARFLTRWANEIEIFSVFFRCRISGKEVIIRAQQVFHDYPTIMPVSQIRTVLA